MDDIDHDLIDALAWPFFFAVFRKDQSVAENLYAAEMGFERHDQSRAIDLGEERAFHLAV